MKRSGKIIFDKKRLFECLSVSLYSHTRCHRTGWESIIS